MPCPFVHLCDESLCHKELVCMNGDYWAEYWKEKGRKEAEESTLSKKDRRRLRKEDKKKVGIRRYYRLRKEAARKEMFAHISNCVKSGSWCDKKHTCYFLGQCVSKMARFQDKPDLLEALKGPLTMKEIVKILSIHDPEPMKSYYRQK